MSGTYFHSHEGIRAIEIPLYADTASTDCLLSTFSNQLFAQAGNIFQKCTE